MTVLLEKNSIEATPAPVLMPVEIRDAWTAALRSGEYQQSQGVLQSKDGYCCLGVLVDVVDRQFPSVLEQVGATVDRQGQLLKIRAGGSHTNCTGVNELTPVLGLGSAGLLQEPVQADEIEPSESLIALNDRGGYSFEQIADVIESGNVIGVPAKVGA